jgi:hypothetical protein
MGRYQVGTASYDADEFGTPWWLARARDAAHRRAYRQIAAFAAAHAPRRPVPRLIIDYACGPGLLIRELHRVFPAARIVGLDESASAIAAAESVLTEAGIADGRVSLRRLALPAYPIRGLPPADLVFFSFPDFRGGDTRANLAHWRARCPADWDAGGDLRRRWRQEAEQGVPPRRETFFKRVAGRNLRQLCRPGGRIVRVEYSNCTRAGMDEVTLAEMRWTEGCLSAPDGDPRHVLSRERASRYVRSGVMRDVYLQTRAADDREGGYLITVLDAV